jgi:hypothetical protein
MSKKLASLESLVAFVNKAENQRVDASDVDLATNAEPAVTVAPNAVLPTSLEGEGSATMKTPSRSHTRLGIDLPEALHHEIRVFCALTRTNIRDYLMDLLEADAGRRKEAIRRL